MSTRSYIAKEQNGKIKAIYCHHDGYIEKGVGVGWTLYKHYQDENKIDELLERGNISILRETVALCRAYDEDASEFNSESEFYTVAYDSWAEFVYLYKDGKWLWSSTDKIDMKPLDNEFADEMVCGECDFRSPYGYCEKKTRYSDETQDMIQAVWVGMKRKCDEV